MLSLDTAPSTPSIVLRITDCTIRIAAPAAVVSVLEAVLANVPRPPASSAADFTIVVEECDDVWEIHGAGNERKLLARRSALPQVVGAVVSTLLTDVARARNFTILRAAVVERDGRALAMLGDDWETAVTLATHLHDRGWRFLGGDNALLDPATLRVFPIEKSLYVSTSFLSHLPLRYRNAVEASPWYVTDQSIAFYAVDPKIGAASSVWSGTARLAGVVVVDGAQDRQPSLHSLGREDLANDRLARLAIAWDEVGAVDLKVGNVVETCDLVEHWFASLRF